MIATPNNDHTVIGTASEPAAALGRGSKLLCINDRNLRRRYRPGPIVRGRVYSVRELYFDHGQPGVLLLGVRGPVGSDGLEQGFLLSRFRCVFA